MSFEDHENSVQLLGCWVLGCASKLGFLLELYKPDIIGDIRGINENHGDINWKSSES
jgi:hypothetical protein